ncbi:MAG: ferredoxin reductase family protein [Candidatus Kerfeldbacteria bacterium]|nr:ferredoxin reductase family protein [Candidatus Kerfeldbacteria bacterium]
MRYYKPIILTLITLTTLPFCLVFLNLDLSVYSAFPKLFWLQLFGVIGSVTGLIGIVLCFWQVLLGSRWITKHITNDLLWINREHQRLGIYGGMFVLVHPFFQMYAYGESWLFLFFPYIDTHFNTQITFGRIAFLLFAVVWVTSAVIRGKISYRPWLYLHYFAYGVLIFAALHIREIGSVLAHYEWLRTLLTAIFPITLVLLIVRLLYACGALQYRYCVVAVHRVGQVVVFRVMPQTQHKIFPRAGQFCYVQLKKLSESHPFSVMDVDERTGELTFGIKSFGKYSKRVFDIAVGAEIFLDGPFGVFCEEGRNAQPKVLIAGGIGITPLYHVVRKYSSEHTYMINCNRTLSEAVGRMQLQEHLGARYTDVISNEQIDDPHVVCGALNEEVLRQRVPQEIWKNAEIFFCGNPKFYAATRVILLRMGIPAKRIHFEAFSL